LVTIGLEKEGIFQAVMGRTGPMGITARVWESPGLIPWNARLCKKQYAPATGPIVSLLLVEFAAGSGLVGADAAGGDLGLEIIFTADGTTGKAAEHGDLSNVS
jgi:hypothetical protein